jgi:glucose-6-phosphate 1-dehydrogenase
VDARFLQKMLYHQGIAGLKSFIATHGDFKRIVVFMALPPHTYAQTAQQLAAESFGKECAVVIEKPFGHDAASACQLDAELHRYFTEDQIFRIDHYLAKEAVQNILVFRFANRLFEPLWRTRQIASIQISACETTGVGDRAAYFDRAGILRDMMQNHLMQLFCLLTMQAPANLLPQAIRAAKIKILRAAQITRCITGQYRGFTEEKNIAPDSSTPTFAELCLRLDTPRWKETPIFMRAGKKLDRTGTEIGITFRSLPRTLFNRQGEVPPNRIIFKIQPAEGILVDVSGKTPGTNAQLTSTAMKFCYRDVYDGELTEAYERLLADALAGDHTLFVSAAEAACSWALFDPWLSAKPALLYEPATMPPSPLGIDWIDFTRYQRACS